MCVTPDLEIETKSDTRQTDDLRVMGHRRWTPRCKWACAAVCLLACVVVGVAAIVVIPFALRLQRGMAYMAEMKQHTSTALTLNGRTLSWYHLDHPVMGGHSESALEVTAAGGLHFYGNISTRDGGFASCSTQPQPLGLTATTAGFNVTVSGNGELFKLTATTSDSVWEPVWQTDLPAPSLEPGVRHTLLLPLSSFTASRMGKPVAGASLKPADIRSVGLNLGLVDMHGDPNPHFRDGAFELTLHSIATYQLAAAPTAAAPATGGGLVASLPQWAPAAASPPLPAAFGSCVAETQRPLRWGSDREIANHICCHNSVYAEYGGYWQTTSFLSSSEGRTEGAEVTFYDSVTGLALFVAPRGRSWADFVAESTAHQWPSFRDEEVIWSNVHLLGGGEVVSAGGTHLGHNLPDGSGNRFCINIVCIAGAPVAAAATATAAATSAIAATAATAATALALAISPAASPPPAAMASTTLARFDGGAAQREWRVTNDPVMGGRSSSRLSVAGGVATFAGTCAIVPSLGAAGFCQMVSASAVLPDASAFASEGALHLTLRSSTPSYQGFMVGFSSLHMPTPPGFRHGSAAFKAGFALPAAAADGWVDVRVPFSAFSVDTSEYTGRCDTTDPNGQTHRCCSALHPEVCPQAQHLASLRSLQLWAEGVEGAFSLEVQSVAAGP